MATKISLKSYPARNGDCFLVSFGNDVKKHIVIDCGFASTFNQYLKKDLLEIHSLEECIERLIITHIDSDHIHGAIKLLKDNNDEKFIDIKGVWHNTFAHLFDVDKPLISREQERILQQIINRGNPKSEAQAGQKLISAEQGTTLGASILKGNYSWNSDFGSKAVCIENRREVKLDETTSFYLLSPDNQKLNGLRELWKNELKKYGVNFDSGSSELYNDAFEMLMAWEKEVSPRGQNQISSTKESLEDLLKKPFVEDETVTNGSSMAFILTIKNKRLLFLGDAHPSLVMKSLFEYQKEGQIIFDLVKVSHHGSFNNLKPELLDKVDSHRFLFSTNSEKHKHPHKETLAHIVSKKSEIHRQLYFNYVTENAEYFNKADWMKEFNYSIHYPDSEPLTIQL